jgi:hypothetical protein
MQPAAGPVKPVGRIIEESVVEHDIGITLLT